MTAEGIDARVDRLLGCGRAAGPRRILGLGEAPVDSATLEAAFTMRCRLVDAASVEDAVKVAARQRLDAAVAVLRIGTAAPSRVRPVRPVDPAILEQRRVPPRRPDRPASMVPPPEGPIAGQRRPVRPEPRITAEHLTAFDRMVLSVLVAGGGWNGRTRVLVAGLAHQAGLDAATLKRVVVGLARFMRQEGVSGTLDEMARTERLPSTGLVAPGPIESAVQRVADGVGREFRGETTASRTRVASLFVLLALAFVGMIVVLITAPSPEVRAIEEQRLADANARALAAEQAAASDPGHVVIPSVREGAVRPVEWSRPPMFGVERAPEAAVLKIDGLPVLEDDLLRLARDLELDPDRVSEARVAQWDHAVQTFSEVWPLLEPGRRTTLVESVLAVLRQADAVGTARRLLVALQVAPKDELTDPLDSWRRAFRAGILGEIVLDDSMPEPVRETARSLVRENLPGSNGRHSRGGPFAALAGRALDTMTEPMVGRIDTEEERVVHETWEWWLRAQESLRVSTELQQAHLRAIGRVLADGRGLAGDGVGADVLGRLVDEVDWSGAGPDPMSVREAYEGWFGDPRIPSESTWVLASLLDGPRGIGWYRPDFIPDPDLGLDGRSAALTRALSAWPEAMVTAAAGEVVAIEPEFLEALDALIPRLRIRIAEAATPIERLDALLAAERLALATALVVDDRQREARAVVDRVRTQLDRGDSGVDLEPATIPRRKPLDGEWSRRLKDAGRDQEEAVAVIESLRSDALTGDLGPIDAAALVDEVWKGRQRVRATARAVVLDVLSRGPLVATTLLGDLDRASTSSENVEFIERYTGEPLPELSSGRLETAMRLAMVRHAASLIDPSIDVVERLAAEISSVIGERVSVRRRQAGLEDEARSVRRNGRPGDTAILAADAMRQSAAGLFLAVGSERSLEAIDRSRAIRRRLADDDLLRLVAAHAAELDYLSFVLEARVPGRRRALAEAKDRAVTSRADAVGGLEQAALGALGLVELERVRMVPRDVDPLGGLG